MTPAEQTLAVMLAAFEAWNPDDSVTAETDVLDAFGDRGERAGYLADDKSGWLSLTEKGERLIARYREHLAAQLCTCGEARGEHDNGGGCQAFRAAS